MTNFVSLHNHSHASILDGFPTIKEYVDVAVEQKMPGIGLSDHGNLNKIYEFIKLCSSKEITPIPGSEFYLAPINPDGAKVKKQIFYGKNGIKNSKFDVSGNGAYLHMTIFAYNNIGLHNLFKLSTISWKPENTYQKPRIDFDMLAENNDGLIVFTGCPSSEISTRFLLDQDDKAYEYANRLKEVFGKERMFVEIMNHNMKQSLERDLLPKQLKLAKTMGLGLVATNDCHYARRDDAYHHSEMLCSQSGAVMSDKPYEEGGKRFAFDGNEYYLKDFYEMEKLFPEDVFPNALKNTILISEMCQDISLDYDPHLKPIPVLPEGFTSEVEYFKHRIQEGFNKKYKNASREIKLEAKRRIKKEFDVIVSSDFVGYFIVVINYLDYARQFSVFDDDGNILASATGMGRGSVPGSIIAYLTDITEVDPIKHDLLFERFLSSGRGSTFEIEYEDGTKETIIASDKKDVLKGDKELTKYVHQLEVGDVVNFIDSEK